MMKWSWERRHSCPGSIQGGAIAGPLLYVLFASKNREERLLDLGNRMQKLVSSSYFGELDALVWACKKTRAFQGTIPVVVGTDNQSLVEKWQSCSLYDSDITVFRRWSWLVVDEPSMEIEFILGFENTGADFGE